jgi:biotin carboxylase
MKTTKPPQRSSVLFINSITREQAQALHRLTSLLGRPLRPILLRDDYADNASVDGDLKGLVQITVNLNNPAAIEQALAPYASDIFVVTYKDDASAAFARHLSPFLAHLDLPLPDALERSTDKTKMRRAFHAYDKSLSPKFVVISDNRPETIDRVERQVGYPLVVKPSGLTSSMLISVCYYREELEQALEQIIQHMALLPNQPKLEVLLEQLMEGTYYSIDAYVGPRGAVRFAPPVYGKTGRDVGFDDFFGYLRLTPTLLPPREIAACEAAATGAIRALGLRNATCHIELMHTPGGWKIIELGPRIGGFRHELYEHAYGLNHALNDLLTRSLSSAEIIKRAKGYAACMQFYPRTEGVLESIDGLDKIKNLPSVKRLSVFKNPGDHCLFAKHGGRHVLELVLFNPKRSDLLGDIRRIEQNLVIHTVPLASRRRSRRLTTDNI